MFGYSPISKFALAEIPIVPASIIAELGSVSTNHEIGDVIGFIGLAVNVDPVFATHGISDAFTFNLGAGGNVESVSAQAVADDIIGFVQLFEEVNVPSVVAESQLGFLNVDAEIRSIQVNVDSVFANSFAGNIFVAATDWIPILESSDADWDDSSPRCDEEQQWL